MEGESVEVAPEPTASIEAAPVEAPQDQVTAEATTETAAAGDTAAVDAVTAAAVPEAVAAPELIEVWRPGGRSDERRPRHDRSRHRHHERAKEGATPAAAAAGEAGEVAKHQRHRRRRNHEFGKPGTEAPLDATAPAADGAPVREPREDNKGRPSRERFRGRDKDKDGRDADQQRGKFAGGRDKGGRDKGGRDSGPSHRQYATSASPRERERPIDPNSPFAKLAALKEQLTANRKDR